MRYYLTAAFALLALMAAAQGKDITFSGTVIDADTRMPVYGAGITTVGGQNRADAVTDQDGYFTLHLRSGFAPGDNIELRITKKGYEVYDKNMVSGSIQPVLQLKKTGSKPALPPRTHKPSLSPPSVHRPVDTPKATPPHTTAHIIIMSHQPVASTKSGDATSPIALAKIREYLTDKGLETTDLNSLYPQPGNMPGIQQVKNQLAAIGITTCIEAEAVLKKDANTYAAMLTISAANTQTGKTLYYKTLSSGYFETSDIDLLIDRILIDNGEELVRKLRGN